MLDHQDITISREELEKRAYELYLQRGAEHGHDHEDWLVAEAQLEHFLLKCLHFIASFLKTDLNEIQCSVKA
jgi:hypothetical protein